MKTLLILSLLFISLKSFAFTLLSDPAGLPKYTLEEVPIDVSSDGCPTTLGLSATALLDDVEEAVESYWNKVPTANIRFVRGNVTNTTSAGLDLTTWINAAGQGNRIVVGCSNSATHFSGSTLGVATIGTIGGQAVGAVLLGDTSNVDNLSREERLAVLAHEIGHAFGLDHSLDETALMYFSVSAAKVQTELTRDDHDGITWLYPHDKDLGGCLGSLGTIAFVGDDDDKGNPPWGMLMTMSLGFLIAMLMAGFIQFLRGLQGPPIEREYQW